MLMIRACGISSRSGLRRRITTAERSELPTTLDSNEEFYRILDQRGSFFDPSQLLSARNQIIIECHSGSHSYLQPQDSIISAII